VKKKRTYNTRLIKRSRSYLLQEIADLYKLHLNAIHGWVKAGLLCIDTQKPRRVHGNDLATFLNARQSTRKRVCQPTEIYCCKCRKPQPVWENAVDFIIRNTKQLNITGLCAVCHARTFRGGSVKKMPEYQKIFNMQTIQGEHLIACDNPPVNCELERRQ
jgi:hypothetical protein